MKLILFAVVVMFKCSRLSSAPADPLAEGNDNKNLSENDYMPNQPAYVASRPPSLSYVSDTDDLGATGVVFQFRRSIKSDNTEIETRRRSALDKGFMRFGRAGGNMIRFGRSPIGPVGPDGSMYEPDDSVPSRMRKNDKNMMRFGRARNDGFMRFGRDFNEDSEADDYNDASEVDDFVNRPVVRGPNNRYDEHGNKILRLGRSSSESGSIENVEEPIEIQPSSERTYEGTGNSKQADRNMLRFGRAENMMRFGRGNVMRFGKRTNMLRFGRGNEDEPPKTYIKSSSSFMDPRQTRASNDRNLLRLGRAGNLIRFGRNEKNLMRFGKRSGPQSISSSTRIYCKDNDCVVQENENQLTENDNAKGDRLQELFGSDPSKQGYGEYIIDK